MKAHTIATSAARFRHVGGASNDPGASRLSGRLDLATHRTLRKRAVLWSLAAMAALLAVYTAALVWADSLRYAADTFLSMWYGMSPVVVGFGIQAGLFVYVRGAGRTARPHGAGALTAAGGASAVSMVACCAHHLTEVLPLLGLAGASLFVTSHPDLFLLAGGLSNLVGIAYMLSIMGRHQLHPPNRGAFAWLLRRVPRHVVAAVAGLSVVAEGIAVVWVVLT